MTISSLPPALLPAPSTRGAAVDGASTARDARPDDEGGFDAVFAEAGAPRDKEQQPDARSGTGSDGGADPNSPAERDRTKAEDGIHPDSAAKPDAAPESSPPTDGPAEADAPTAPEDRRNSFTLSPANGMGMADTPRAPLPEVRTARTAPAPGRSVTPSSTRAERTTAKEDGAGASPTSASASQRDGATGPGGLVPRSSKVTATGVDGAPTAPHSRPDPATAVGRPSSPGTTGPAQGPSRWPPAAITRTGSSEPGQASPAGRLPAPSAATDQTQDASATSRPAKPPRGESQMSDAPPSASPRPAVAARATVSTGPTIGKPSGTGGDAGSPTLSPPLGRTFTPPNPARPEPPDRLRRPSPRSATEMAHPQPAPAVRAAADDVPPDSHMSFRGARSDSSQRAPEAFAQRSEPNLDARRPAAPPAAPRFFGASEGAPDRLMQGLSCRASARLSAAPAPTTPSAPATPAQPGQPAPDMTLLATAQPTPKPETSAPMPRGERPLIAQARTPLPAPTPPVGSVPMTGTDTMPSSPERTTPVPPAQPPRARADAPPTPPAAETQPQVTRPAPPAEATLPPAQSGPMAAGGPFSSALFRSQRRVQADTGHRSVPNADRPAAAPGATQEAQPIFQRVSPGTRPGAPAADPLPRDRRPPETELLRDGRRLPAAAHAPVAPAAQQVVSTVRPMPLAAMPPATGQVPPSEQTLDVDSLPGESDGPLPSGELPQTAGEALRLSTSATRPDMARPLAQQIAQQIAQAAGRAAQAPTEVRLDPEELGRVTLRLSTEDGGVTLHVTAERAETSDLMRRHISLLEESYRSLGYDRIEIAINGRQAGGHPGQGGHGNGQETPAGTGGAPLTQPAPETSTAAPAASPGSSDRIDIRL
ncbi:Flagellar hook-length control protein FliK [Pseudooceanicola marinus]|uniref:Flagellar hook-length control protein FliK n=1 Tax=Pseudooceanicola marinus TaxID=396013 RepID=A0A1X6ZN62_9RHOB|nr:hypothetical protein CVM50_18480 [Pseudooceanicola marinus]SLN56668.1 Flagellar hook-length control protein FliK [Pseudooceanicola marinus]